LLLLFVSPIYAVTLRQPTLSKGEAEKIFPASALAEMLHLNLRFPMRRCALWQFRDIYAKLRPPDMRILIVEDEPDLLRSIAQALREEGYAVDTAAEGEDGFYKAENYDYDAIVLDVMLPKMDGWEILKRLRKTKKTPVLMLTARDQTRDRVKGLDTGADDYVVKPFDLPELFARLRALIRRSANKSNNVIEIGDVKIDTAARHVFFKDKLAELTAREYSLVKFLALHRGEVVTRTQLYEHLFDENESSLSNLLDVHVSNVRKKLGAEFIVTRRGHGYCIE
jgi:two-component system OmpR family response regulator